VPSIGDDDLCNECVDQLFELCWVAESDCVADVLAQDREVGGCGDLGGAEQGASEFVAAGSELVGLLGESVDALAALFAGELLVLECGQVGRMGYRIEPRSATVVSATEPGGLTRFRF
jgi:hypothetical protein